jgi:polysaccharide export outer membrane protein
MDIRSRIRRLLLPVLALAAAAPALPSRAADGPAAPASEAASKPKFIYTLLPTDKLRITVYQEDDLATVTKIDANGNVNLPLVGQVKVVNMTVDQAQDAIADAYIKGRFLRHPQVTVVIDEYAVREVTINGCVRNPSRYQLPNESFWTVLDLVTKAGGFTDIAKKSSVKLTRYLPDGTTKVMTVDVDAMMRGKGDVKSTDPSLRLQPGDIVFVPESII